MNDLSHIDYSYLEEVLQKGEFHAELGIRIGILDQTEIGGEQIELIVVKVDPGRQLIPHLHETGGEICIPVTMGLLTLGDAQKNTDGSYKMNGEGKILVDWGKHQQLTPGKALNVLPGKAHHLFAPKESAFVLMFLLPKTHLSTDRKFTTYPQA